jgi:hypothetical protein
MRRPGTICVTTALPIDTDTLNRSRTISAAERHGHSGYENRKPNAESALDKFRALQRIVVQVSLSPTVQGGPGPEAVHPSEEINKKKEFLEALVDAALASVPFALDIANERIVLRLSEDHVREIEQRCNHIVDAMVQIYEESQNSHMSPLTRVRGQSLTSRAAQGRRLIALWEGIPEFLEGFGLGIELADMGKTGWDLWVELHNHEWHDGGRMIAYLTTKVLILSFVVLTGVFAIACASAALTELAAFGALVGFFAWPLAFLKPDGYVGTAMDGQLEKARTSGHTYSKEYMEAARKYLHDPSPANLANLNAIKRPM